MENRHTSPLSMYCFFSKAMGWNIFGVKQNWCFFWLLAGFGFKSLETTIRKSRSFSKTTGDSWQCAVGGDGPLLFPYAKLSRVSCWKEGAVFISCKYHTGQNHGSEKLQGAHAYLSLLLCPAVGAHQRLTVPLMIPLFCQSNENQPLVSGLVPQSNTLLQVLHIFWEFTKIKLERPYFYF